MRASALFALTLLSSIHLAFAHTEAKPQEVVLWLQEAAMISEDISVRFVGFVDERCPSDRRCAQQGEVIAWLELAPAVGPRRSVTLQSPPGIDSRLAGTAFGFRFCFVGLNPRPHTQRNVNPAAHLIRFVMAPERKLTKCTGS